MDPQVNKHGLYSGRIFAIDFDGTCVTHEYPKVGKDIGAAPVLRRLVSEGALIILLTMRDKKELKDAVKWFENNNITLYGINENPEQHHWTTSRKTYAHTYIDDAGLFTPLIYNDVPERPYVDWSAISTRLFGNITEEK